MLRKILLLFVLTGALGTEGAEGPVRSLHLYKSYNDTAAIFDKACDTAQMTNGVGKFLLGTVANCREAAAKDGKSPSAIGSMGGRWLEWGVLVALKENRLVPAYWQAEFVQVPKNYNDVLLWSKEYGPVILSCKTSLRERYKQADLEAVALRQHYPNARFFLVTLDEDKRHVASVRRKIVEKELLALHAVYDETNMEELFATLRKMTLTEVPERTLKSGQAVR